MVPPLNISDFGFRLMIWDEKIKIQEGNGLFQNLQSLIS